LVHVELTLCRPLFDYQCQLYSIALLEAIMNLKEFGRILKEKRLRQGLELVEVMEKTKISRMSLEAIEEGNEQALPHPVYAKGFVKNYAKFLGLNADKMGNTLAQIYVSEEESGYEDPTVADSQDLPSERQKAPRLTVYAGIALVLVFMVIAAWVSQESLRGIFFSSSEDSTRSQDVSPGDQHLVTDGRLPGMTGQDFSEGRQLDSASETLLQSFPDAALEAGSETGDDLALPELESQAAVAETGAGVALQSGVGPQSGTVSQQDAAPLPVAQTPQESAVVSPAGIEKTLEIRAFENCWLSAQADEVRPREVFLRPNERFVITFKNSLELKLGNAGGVTLYLDGRPWPLNAQSGEVMVLRLP
jgi:cytoskeleton protein RodZ